MNGFVKLAQEYVSEISAEEANAMALLIFYESIKKAVAAGQLTEESLTEDGMMRLFEMGIKGKGVIPSIFEAAGIPLKQAH